MTRSRHDLTQSPRLQGPRTPGTTQARSTPQDSAPRPVPSSSKSVARGHLEAVASPEPCSVYRYYQGDDLLYVGITKRGTRRGSEHARRAEWWPLVTRSEVEHFASRAEAEAEERRQILEDRPLFNRQLPGRGRPPTDAEAEEARKRILALFESGQTELARCMRCHRETQLPTGFGLRVCGRCREEIA